MTRRSGLTLTEVLVTLAILAFGILAILTLFPLAASQMAIAVREDRSAQAANAADGYMRAYWKTQVVENTGPPEAFYSAFDTPGGGLPPTGGVTEWSYPVAVDPMGVSARGATQLGDSANTQVPRRSLGLLGGNPTYAFRVCSQMDGMSYDDNGHPSAPGGMGTAERELRYNWMWVLQCSAGTRTTANMSVVVFDNRPNLYAPTGSEAVVKTASDVVPGTTQLTLYNMNVKPGNWIMDVTDPTDNASLFPTNKIRHGYFYQVLSVVDNPAYTILELQTPLRKPNDPGFTGPTYKGKFVVMRGVTGVYSRPALP